jgi:MarR-like DNA-binding transcriptional regulator SgrR of sgrS sRNA
MERKTGSIEDLFAAEQTALAAHQIIPLFHLPVSYATSTNVKRIHLRPDGSIDLADVWLESAAP